MEINVTSIKELDCSEFSNSVFNSGLENIGEITWKAAQAYFDSNPLLVEPNDRQELEDYLADFGAWSREEISAWSDIEINALLLQMIAAEIQEYETAEDRGELEQWEQAFGGQLYSVGDSWFYYIGV